MEETIFMLSMHHMYLGPRPIPNICHLPAPRSHCLLPLTHIRLFPLYTYFYSLVK
jgi:hypothetical protein